MTKQKVGENVEQSREIISEDAYRELLTNELERKGLGGTFVWAIFFLTVTPNILNGFHVSSYTLLGYLPDDQWCGVNELQQTNWTIQQQRNITEDNLEVKSCTIWDWDYKFLSQLNYDDALSFVEQQKKPAEISCHALGTYQYAAPETTFVADWDLICENALARTAAQVAVSVGKFLGSFSFGIFSDKYGRKTSFCLGAIFFITSSVICTFSPWYTLFLIGRFGLGAASSGLFYPAFSLIVENICLRHRSWMSICFSASYPIGMIIMAIAAYFVRPWRYLQLALTIPSLLLILNCYLMNESPRWLINKKRYDSAYKVLYKRKTQYVLEKQPLTTKNQSTNKEEQQSCGHRIKEGPFKDFLKLFATWKARKLILTSYFMFGVTSLSYYVTALNAANMNVSRFLYVMFTGLVDLPSLFLPMSLLHFFGRRVTTMSLFWFTSAALLCVLAVSRDNTNWIVACAMLGRFGISATYAIVTLYTAELYPIEVRNSALGTCSTWAHVGSISAPYIVDVLGQFGWYIPTTICGICVFIAGILTIGLPETGIEKLPNNLEELPSETVKGAELKSDKIKPSSI